MGGAFYFRAIGSRTEGFGGRLSFAGCCLACVQAFTLGPDEGRSQDDPSVSIRE